MTSIKRNALVNYTARQMFELVNHIQDYPRFLPWCSASHIHHNDAEKVEATLDISFSGMSKSFTTRNHLYPYERIDITLVDGPFRQLEGRWRFTPLGDKGCRVDLELEFELTGSFLDKLFQPIFHNIANSLVDLFCRRAVEIYGTE